MKKLAMLLLVLAFCAPSFGAATDINAVLVYKVTLSEKNVLVDANFETALDNNDTAAKVLSSANFKGFLIFQVRTSDFATITDTNGVTDGNQNPVLILEGKDPITGVKTKYVLQGDINTVSINRLVTTEAKPKRFANLSFNGFTGIVDANLASSGNTWGKLTATALVKGSKIKYEVPKSSVKGTGFFENFPADNAVKFTAPVDGTLTLTLDTKKTGEANLFGLQVKVLKDLLD